MLLTLSTTHQPATDLGYLLHKNPARAQSFDLSFGKAHVFYADAANDLCTAALLLDVDTVDLVRGKRGDARTLAQYVNDRPYVASSYLSVAINQVFRSALGGQCKERPELVDTPMPLTARLSVVRSPGGEDTLRRLFEPLGYSVKVDRRPLDPTFPEWGDSPYYALTLTSTCRVADMLTHLYVLIPTLDTQKHYYIGDAEVEKLIAKGEGWLSTHPEKDMIVRRYLRNRSSLVKDALDQLTREDEPGVDDVEARHDAQEEAIERPLSLHDLRLAAVAERLKESGAKRVLDLGCGEGRLLTLLMKERQFEEIVGMDVAYGSLEKAQSKLKIDRLPEMQQRRIKLIQGSLIYRDSRLTGYDAAAVVEVIEHLDPPRLAAFERNLFLFAKPSTVIITTPNQEYNSKFESLPAGQFRHADHRFEWTRAEFEAWSAAVATRFGYSVTFAPIGPEDAEVGAPSQMGVFVKQERN